ncbi:MAG: FAD-dependent oxidoreductase, partial [Planctomycetaceae bacterium]|nr:FAD-dependent oxidoreductase [Planctomycetaceae bacterium]
MSLGINYRYFLIQRFRFILVLCTGFNLAFIATENFGAEKKLYDLVIYGPTSAGIAAAVQAQRMGLDVIVTGPDTHLGGLSAGGLGWTDSGNKEVIGGIALEFYKRIYAYYDKPETWTWQTRTSYGKRGRGTQARDGHGRAMWVFEPHVAEQVFENLIHDHMIPIDRNQWLDRS